MVSLTILDIAAPRSVAQEDKIFAEFYDSNEIAVLRVTLSKIP